MYIYCTLYTNNYSIIMEEMNLPMKENHDDTMKKDVEKKISEDTNEDKTEINVFQILDQHKDENNVYHNPLFTKKNNSNKRKKNNRNRRKSWGQKHLYHQCSKSITIGIMSILYIIETVMTVMIGIDLEHLYLYQLFLLYGILIIQICVLHLYQESRQERKTKFAYVLLPNYLIIFVYFIVLSTEQKIPSKIIDNNMERSNNNNFGKCFLVTKKDDIEFNLPCLKNRKRPFFIALHNYHNVTDPLSKLQLIDRNVIQATESFSDDIISKEKKTCIRNSNLEFDPGAKDYTIISAICAKIIDPCDSSCHIIDNIYGDNICEALFNEDSTCYNEERVNSKKPVWLPHGMGGIPSWTEFRRYVADGTTDVTVRTMAIAFGFKSILDDQPTLDWIFGTVMNELISTVEMVNKIECSKISRFVNSSVKTTSYDIINGTLRNEIVNKDGNCSVSKFKNTASHDTTDKYFDNDNFIWLILHFVSASMVNVFFIFQIFCCKRTHVISNH